MAVVILISTYEYITLQHTLNSLSIGNTDMRRKYIWFTFSVWVKFYPFCQFLFELPVVIKVIQSSMELWKKFVQYKVQSPVSLRKLFWCLKKFVLIRKFSTIFRTFGMRVKKIDNFIGLIENKIKVRKVEIPVCKLN